jgi:hypothetical protein
MEVTTVYIIITKLDIHKELNNVVHIFSFE